MLLVVAATSRELDGVTPAARVVCGIGPVEAAARTAATLAERRPAAVLHVGIAGMRRGCELALLDCVIGSASLYADSDLAPVLEPDRTLLAAAQRALPQARSLPIGTSGRVGGAQTTLVEAMEGYAVLRAAKLAGVPGLEVRVISNEIEEEDRGRWLFDEAFERVTEVTRVLARALVSVLVC